MRGSTEMITYSGGRPTMRRTTALTLLVAAAMTALAGCEDNPGGTAAPAPSQAAGSATAAPAGAAPAQAADGGFDPEQAVAVAEKTPYATTMTTSTAYSGTAMLATTGRINVNTLFTGRVEMRSTGEVPADQAVWLETVTTADAVFVRNRVKAGSAWTKAARTDDTAGQANYAGYARLLLATGPSARKGMENEGGAPAQHLAGHLGLDQVATIDPGVLRTMKAKGVTDFDCDLWIDGQGRTVRFEQRMDVQGVPVVNKVFFGEFGPVETFAAPTGG
ncbi:hypothetical protein ACFRKE_03555 [Kitasatospora indigofera]|uniref:hypothetical protein n=1 Tax=Kitasatospora indigofera TaxID=67307 RepID=UPI0036B45B30